MESNDIPSQDPAKFVNSSSLLFSFGSSNTKMSIEAVDLSLVGIKILKKSVVEITGRAAVLSS